MDEDEDVVYEGSPIFRHLQDTGFTDFETSELCRISPSLEDEILQYQEDEKNNKKEWCDILPGLFNSFFDPFTRRKQEEYKFEETLVKTVLDSNLISEDDRLILEHFLPSWNRVTGTNAENETNNIKEIGFGASTALLVGFLSIIYGALNETWAVTLIFATIFLTREASRYYVAHHYKAAAEWQIAVVAALKKNNLMISKAIRLLQEVQLVARGFVLMVGGGNSSSCGEVESSPQYLHLHSFLHPAIACLYAYLQDVHSRLSAQPKTVDYPTMEGLFTNLPELLTDEERIQLKMLKDLSTLSKLQISAVLTQFLLSLGKDDHLYQMSLDQEVIFPLRDTKLLDTMSSTLEKKINYTRSFWLREYTVEEAKNKLSYESKKSDVYIAVHSLSLHMQAALYKVQEMELRFDKCAIDNDREVESAPPYELVCEQLAAVKMELESCMGCWEEAQQRVMKKYNVEDDSAVPKLSENSPSIPDMGEEVKKDFDNKRAPIVLFDTTDPVIQDEVFEAYIDQEYSAKRELDSEDDLLKQSRRSEREKLKRNTAQGKRVLKELQPILVKRREMWEKREEIAFKRQQQQQQDSQEQSQQLNLQQQENHVTDSQGKDVIHTDTEDSDEERLTNYRKIRKQMEEEEKAQYMKSSEAEKRENIYSYPHKNNDAASEEEDSDEERLRQYRAVRASLEEQEKYDNKEEISKRKYQNCQVISDKIVISNSNNSGDFAENIENFSDSKENLISCDTFRSHAVSNVPDKVILSKSVDEQSLYSDLFQNNSDEGYDSLVGIQKCKLIKNIENKAIENILTTNKDNDLKGKIILDNEGNEKCEENIHEFISKSQVNNKEETFDSGSEIEETINKTKNVKKHNANMSEETFGCGSDFSDEECEHSIDWSVVPPPRQLNNLEERLTHLSGMVGFQAQVAAQAAAAGRLGTAWSHVGEETFGGFGEGEEQFPHTDDEEGEEKGK